MPTVDYTQKILELKTSDPEYHEMAVRIAEELNGKPHTGADIRLQATSVYQEAVQKLNDYRSSNPSAFEKIMDDLGSAVTPDAIERGGEVIAQTKDSVIDAGSGMIHLLSEIGETRLAGEITALRGKIGRISEAESSEIAYHVVQKRMQLNDISVSSSSEHPFDFILNVFGAIADSLQAAWLAVRTRGSFSEIYDSLKEKRNAANGQGDETQNTTVEIVRERSLQLHAFTQDLEFGEPTIDENGVNHGKKTVGADLAEIVTRINPTNKRFTDYPLTEKRGQADIQMVAAEEAEEHNPNWASQVYNYYAGENTALKLFMTAEGAIFTGTAIVGAIKAVIDPAATGFISSAVRSTGTGRAMQAAVGFAKQAPFPRAIVPLAAIAAGTEAYAGVQEGDGEKVAEAVTGFGGGVAGATAGAGACALGGPWVATGCGVIGGALGYIVGREAVEQAFDLSSYREEVMRQRWEEGGFDAVNAVIEQVPVGRDAVRFISSNKLRAVASAKTELLSLLEAENPDEALIRQAAEKLLHNATAYVDPIVTDNHADQTFSIVQSKLSSALQNVAVSSDKSLNDVKKQASSVLEKLEAFQRGELAPAPKVDIPLATFNDVLSQGGSSELYPALEGLQIAALERAVKGGQSFANTNTFASLEVSEVLNPFKSRTAPLKGTVSFADVMMPPTRGNS